MLRRLVAATAAFFLMAAGSVSAQEDEEPEFGKIGGYAGIAGSYAVNDGRGSLGTEMFDSGGVQVWIGYRMDETLGLELQGEWQDGLKELNGFTIGGNLNLYPMAFFAPGSWFQPFAIGGVGVLSAKQGKKSSDLNAAFRLGGGFDVYLTEKWSVRVKAEWVTGVGRLNKIAYAPMSIGAQYNW